MNVFIGEGCGAFPRERLVREGALPGGQFGKWGWGGFRSRSKMIRVGAMGRTVLYRGFDRFMRVSGGRPSPRGKDGLSSVGSEVEW